MRSKLLLLATSAAFLAGSAATSFADDGAITNKSMSRTINLPDYGQDIVNNAVPEAEHAFTDMMGFYVPSQAASGLVEPIPYCDIDNQPAPGEDCTNPVEELVVAKPLVNVFIYGPAFGVPETAFAHRFFDTFAAVSLDDGETWKQTNLSESADLSSFNLDTDHIPSGGGGGGPPQGHNIELCGQGDCALHAAGYDTPYTAHCSECHGVALQGNTGAPSCYSCHENVWSEEPPVELGPIVYQAEYEGNTLDIEGENAGDSNEVVIKNAITDHVVGTTESEDTGEFEFEQEFDGTLPPCVVYAEYTDNTGETFDGPALSVTDEATGLPIEECEGLPLDITDYPGGTYNVFQATAGNKTLVAWPSRFCSQGQPAYQMTTETNPDLERLDAVVSFIQNGDAELGVDGLPDFTMEDDLYLLDAFGVAGRQGSVDFADEGYPQAGVVPFGCVWTARGVVLPGDDPRTDELEASHMVWTKAERLTSGRRDPNRIEVKAVKGAGFVITWQEDPDGLRPGQGLGPGEGWSGAVAHAQTDVWYSFINEEYFDIVENPDNTTEPVDILYHDLALTGRPQVYVPMAVPMRVTNNAKCNAPVEGIITDDLYCDFELAEPYGLKDQCADQIDIPVGPNDALQPICVADSDGDGVADLPNRANTASTRPRLGAQGYDLADDDRSAWVVFAAEESKGLGAYFFEPDADNDGYAESCLEESDTCTAEIGKNQWYHSFDMGTPDTSAGIGQPNSLVENLVYQGDMLNQAEVQWDTGELYGLMSTEEMWDYGDYNFDIVNTEIARRASLLIQSIEKAVDAGENALLATPSWKQGTMRQGGPADTMLRRILLPDGYGGGVIPEVCPIVVDAEVPVVTVARVRLNQQGTLVLNVTVKEYDDDPDTGIQLRNAVSGDLYGPEKQLNQFDQTSIVIGGANAPGPVPCAVQAADADGSLEFGPWIAVDMSEAPEGVVCEPPVPEICLDGGTTFTAGLAAATEGIDINPYAFENMACETWLIEAGENPYYPKGVCADAAVNLSGVVPDTCLDDDTGGEVACPTIDCDAGSTYCIGDTNPILQGIVQGEGNTQRVLTWHQCPSEGTVIASDGITPVECETDETNLADQSWYNPLDISKGHRGFIDGNFIQFLYAWSPTWRLNAKGHDRYELYVRRSFDGGETWTVTPSSFQASDGLSYSGDGTVTCESYRRSDTGSGSDTDEPKACYEFAAGAAEHARNITQHRSMRITTLDPRYAPTKATIEEGCTDGLFVDDSVILDIFTCDDLSLDMDSDLRDPSRYFMVFETGDNTTVEVGEAEPLDLFYGRAESFGDDYVVWTETDTDSADLEPCYPNTSYGVIGVEGTILEGSGFCNEFDNMNTRGDTHSSEANLEANPDGSKMYGVWAQWVFDDTGEEVVESDAMARRIWWIDDYVSDTESYTLPGTQQP